MIVTTSSFGFVPSGGQPNEYGSPGVAEYGDRAIHDALIEGFNINGGYWNGTNGIFSSTAANDPNVAFGIGWLDNSADFYSTWWGQPVSRGQSIIVLTWYGDANLDGIVNNDDYGFWSNTMSSNPLSYIYGGTRPKWVNGDFDYSGAVNGGDLALWQYVVTAPGANYSLGFNPRVEGGAIVPASGSVLPAPQDLAVGNWPGSVPEPGSVALLLLTAVGFAVFRGLRGKRFGKGIAFLACFLAPLFGGHAVAQLVIVGGTHVVGSVHIAGGSIDLDGASLIVTTSAFGFVPSGGQPNEYGSPGVAEYGDPAIHDALVEGGKLRQRLLERDEWDRESRRAKPCGGRESDDRLVGQRVYRL